MSWQAEVLWAGSARGSVLYLEAPISFWGGVDPKTSAITVAGHPQCGMLIHDTVLVLPRLVGSSSSSAIMLELLYKNLHPRAMILGERDAILPMGVVVAQQMGWTDIPVLLLPDPPFATGDVLSISSTGVIERS